MVIWFIQSEMIREDLLQSHSCNLTYVGNQREMSWQRRDLTLVSCEFTHFVKVFF